MRELGVLTARHRQRGWGGVTGGEAWRELLLLTVVAVVVVVVVVVVDRSKYYVCVCL